MLHNILVNINDNWERNEGWWSREVYDEELLVLNEDQVQRGLQKKEQVKKMVLGL